MNRISRFSLWLFVIAFVLPLYWLFTSSVKTDQEITQFPPTIWPHHVVWSNFIKAWQVLHFGTALMNTLLVCLTVTSLIVVFATLAGYAFSKKNFYGKNVLLMFLVGTMVVPPTVLLLPLYFVITKLGMYDSLVALVLPFSITVFSILFMKQYMDEIPDDLLEAAKIDGASDWAIFTKIILPLIGPAAASVFLIEFVNNWNSFTMPLVLLQNPQKFTISLRLGELVSQNVAVPWSSIMAGNVLTVLPVLVIFLLLQKYFIRGIMAGAVKG